MLFLVHLGVIPGVIFESTGALGHPLGALGGPWGGLGGPWGCLGSSGSGGAWANLFKQFLGYLSVILGTNRCCFPSRFGCVVLTVLGSIWIQIDAMLMPEGHQNTNLQLCKIIYFSS